MKRILVLAAVLASSLAQAADVKPLTLNTGVITIHADANRSDVGAGVTGTGTIDVNGTVGVAVKANNGTVITVTANTATVASGAELETTGTGMIDLPAQFKVANTQVSANVTAANLGTLTAGASSDATTLHTHSANVITGLTTTGLSAGQFVYVSATNTVLATDNAVSAKSISIGVYNGTSTQIVGNGSLIAAALFTTAGGTCVPGAWAYLAAAADDTGTGAGKLTATAPTAGGTFQAPVAVVLDDTGYAGSKVCKVVVRLDSIKAN